MRLRRNGGLALLTAIALAACNDANAPDSLDAELNEEAAMLAADAALEDLGQMVISLGGAPAPAFAAAGPPTTRSRTVTFFDAAGNQQDAYNAETTASMNIVVEMSGAVERDTWTATVERSRDMTVSGLEGQETSRIWNGTGTGDVLRAQTLDDVDRSYAISSSSVIAAVVRGLPRDENPWPLSGTITRSLTITITNGPNGDEVRTRDVAITFDGTQFATVIVNGEEFELDLAARADGRPIRRRNQ